LRFDKKSLKKSFLLLSGPPGSAKFTSVLTICNDLGVAVIEWRNTQTANDEFNFSLDIDRRILNDSSGKGFIFLYFDNNLFFFTYTVYMLYVYMYIYIYICIFLAREFINFLHSSTLYGVAGKNSIIVIKVYTIIILARQFLGLFLDNRRNIFFSKNFIYNLVLTPFLFCMSREFNFF